MDDIKRDYSGACEAAATAAFEATRWPDAWSRFAESNTILLFLGHGIQPLFIDPLFIDLNRINEDRHRVFFALQELDRTIGDYHSPFWLPSDWVPEKYLILLSGCTQRAVRAERALTLQQWCELEVRRLLRNRLKLLTRIAHRILFLSDIPRFIDKLFLLEEHWFFFHGTHPPPDPLAMAIEGLPGLRGRSMPSFAC